MGGGAIGAHVFLTLKHFLYESPAIRSARPEVVTLFIDCSLHISTHEMESALRVSVFYKKWTLTRKSLVMSNCSPKT